MNNTAINIRIFFWHWQVTFSGDWSFRTNYSRIEKDQWSSIFSPVSVYDFKPWKIGKGRT